MDKPFQRKGAKSNTHVGKEFEKAAKNFLSTQGLLLQKDIPIDIGINGKKPHNFDLGNLNEKILVECKSHTWTESGNVPRRLSENGYFPQSLRQAQILILKILNVFLRLKSSPSLTLQKISHSRTAS